jgi:hypothetical protein
MIIDRANRDKLVETIDSYLHEEMTAFQFDEAIFTIRDGTEDQTIQRVVDLLWCFYDDCDDNKVILDRTGWNCFQRLRLLLKSDAHLYSYSKRIWSASQVIAAMALLVFIWFVYTTGLGSHLMIVAIPFGLVSIGLSMWRRRLYRKASNWDATLYPFTSIAQLLWIGQGVPGFRKESFRCEVASRRIRRYNAPIWIQYPFWLLYSPAILLVQLLPITVPERRIVL